MGTTKKVLIFGAGSYGRSVFENTRHTVIGFIDNDPEKQGSSLEGQPIYSPKQISQVKHEGIIIASTFEHEIRHQLIAMGLCDAILSEAEATSHAKVTPVNHEKIERSPEEMRNDANYALTVANGYLQKFSDDFTFFQAKTILELGPGINLGTALILQAWGAKSVIVSDRYLSPFTPGYHDVVYQIILELLEQEGTYQSLDPIRTCLNTANHDTGTMITTQKPLESLSNVFTNDIDVSLSNAVFEHLYNPLEAFVSLYNCMKPGGVGSHQVDFRDHRDFNRPLEFLLMDELSFFAQMEKACCEFGNRMRPCQMDALFKQVGFKQVRYESNLQASDEYLAEFIPRLRNNITSPYYNMAEEQLTSVSGLFSLKK